MPSTTVDEVFPAALQEARRAAALIRGLDEAEADQPAAGADGWTIRDVAVHLVTLLNRALSDFRRSQSPAETARLNAQCIAELGALPLAEIVERIEDNAPTVFEQILPSVDPSLEVPFHAGISATIPQAGGVLLMEFLVHGDDIARAAHRAWPVDDAVAALALERAAPLLRGWLTPDARRRTASFGFDLGELAPHAYFVDGGRVRVERSREALQRCAERTTVSAAELLLTLLGRRPTTDPVLRDYVSLFEKF